MINNRFEINVTEGQNHKEIIEFARKYACPAVVVPPKLVAQYVAMRGILNAKFKIITTLGQGGSAFAMQKLRDMPQDGLASDGFDVMCSYVGNSAAMFNEVTSVTQFFRSMNPLYEIRWAIDVVGRGVDAADEYLKALKSNRSNYLRLGQTIKSVPEIMSVIGHTSSIINMPIKVPVAKLSDVDGLDVGTYRFDLSFDMAKEILNVKKETKEIGKESLVQQIVDGEKVIGPLGQDAEGINN